MTYGFPANSCVSNTCAPHSQAMSFLSLTGHGGGGPPLPLSTSRRSPSADVTRYNLAARKILSGAPRLPDCGLPQSGDPSRADAIFSQRISESFRRGLLGIAAFGFKGGVRRRFPDRIAIPSRGDH